jgi:hypothetical protein
MSPERAPFATHSSISGYVAIARARAMRCCSPPERSAANTAPLPAGDAFDALDALRSTQLLTLRRVARRSGVRSTGELARSFEHNDGWIPLQLDQRRWKAA